VLCRIIRDPALSAALKPAPELEEAELADVADPD
jgi:hypothetical protein